MESKNQKNDTADAEYLKPAFAPFGIWCKFITLKKHTYPVLSVIERCVDMWGSMQALTDFIHGTVPFCIYVDKYF